MAKKLPIGIVLSGTAPAMTLMSGAMLAFDKCNVEFDVISTTGVGGLIGMLYLAPKGKSREQALRELPNLFVSDWLYRVVPINFKVFHKYSPFATSAYNFRKRISNSLPFRIGPEDSNEIKRFVNDWIELWATALTPASHRFTSKGFMSHVPFVEDLVDFARLKKSETRFYLNAFSLTKRRLRIFNNHDVEKTECWTDYYNGAQAMYMLFPPVRTDDDLLMTGATCDPTGLQAIWTTDEREKLTGVLALDPLTECFWRIPTDTYDAFQLMLMNPIVHLQQLIYALYARTDMLVNGPPGGSGPSTARVRLPRLFSIKAEIPEAHRPKILKWTHENAMILQKAGYDAALPIARQLSDTALTDAALQEALSPRRFGESVLRTQPRSQQFLSRPFGPMFEPSERYGRYFDDLG